MSTREPAATRAEPKRPPPIAKPAPAVAPALGNQALLSSVVGFELEAEEARADAFADRVQPGGRPSPEDHGREPLAVTRGGVTSFAPHAPSSTTPAGRWLRAHEAAHVAQQEAGPTRERAYRPGEKFHDPDSDIVSDVPDAIPKDVMDPTSGLDVDQVVDVAAPLLAGQKKKGDDADQRWHLHSGAIAPLIPLSAFAIPRTKLTLDSAGKQSAAAPASPDAARPADQPSIAPGAEVYAPGNVKLAVLGSDAANVFVEGTGAIHYAVGAGSCVLVETNSGFYLFDAGINLHEGHALAQRIPDLRIPTGPTSVTSTTGEVMHVSRELHGIMRLDALYQDDVLLVGVAGSGKVAGMVNIVALNDAAVEVLGTTATTAVHESRLMAATEDDLAR